MTRSMKFQSLYTLNAAAISLLSLAFTATATQASSDKLSADERAAVVAQADIILSRACAYSFRIYINGRKNNAFFHAMDKTGNSACGWTDRGADDKAIAAAALKKCNGYKAKNSVSAECQLFAVNNRLVRGVEHYPLAEGEEGLKSAITHGLIGRMTKLLDSGLDVNTRTDNGNTALLEAAASGDFDNYTGLLDRGADRTITMNNGSNLLMAAVIGGNMKIVRDALAHNIDPNQPGTDGNTPLHAAVRKYHYYAAQVLLDSGGDPDLKNDQGDSVVSILKSSDKDLTDLKAEYNFWNARKNNDLPAMQSIYESLSAEERSGAIKKATMLVNRVEADTYAYLLAQGANPNQRDRHDSTPLIEASTYNNVNVAKLLLKAGADKTAVNGDGKSALDYAKTEAMRALLK